MITYAVGDYIHGCAVICSLPHAVEQIRPLDTNNRGLRQVSANISSACPPSSRVSPICHSAKPYGQGNTRLSHIKRRRLIMPLVALVQKNHSAPATSYSRLVLGTRYGRRRCSSSSVFEKVSACLRKKPYFSAKHGFFIAFTLDIVPP